MLGARLLGVRAADDFSAYSAVSIRVLGAIRMGSGAGAYHIQWPAGRGTCPSVSHCAPSYALPVLHSRSLLSREALEQHLGVAVDAQVLDRLGVRRRAGRISLPRGGCAESGAQRASESLHRDNGAATKADRREDGRYKVVSWSCGWAETMCGQALPNFCPPTRKYLDPCNATLLSENANVNDFCSSNIKRRYTFRSLGSSVSEPVNTRESEVGKSHACVFHCPDASGMSHQGSKLELANIIDQCVLRGPSRSPQVTFPSEITLNPPSLLTNVQPVAMIN
jgi:hypothetical protein